MKTLRLPKDRLEAFTEVLGGFGAVHAPLQTDKGLAFGRLDEIAARVLDVV